MISDTVNKVNLAINSAEAWEFGQNWLVGEMKHESLGEIDWLGKCNSINWVILNHNVVNWCDDPPALLLARVFSVVSWLGLRLLVGFVERYVESLCIYWCERIIVCSKRYQSRRMLSRCSVHIVLWAKRVRLSSLCVKHVLYIQKFICYKRRPTHSLLSVFSMRCSCLIQTPRWRSHVSTNHRTTSNQHKVRLGLVRCNFFLNTIWC